MKAQLGEISSGTLRSEDLVESFARELEYITNAPEERTDAESALIAECGKWQEDPRGDHDGGTFYEDWESEGAELVNSLIDALTERAPPYAYFGASEGDGASFGFWLGDVLDDADSFDGLRVSDTSEVPDDYCGEVLHVNDHGNATLYVAESGKLREVWAVV